jgi:molybdopterin molybdotransferase
MISYEAALSIAREAGARRLLGHERVPLDAAVGRTLAADVRSPEALPRSDNSGVDGFALRAAEVVGASPSAPVALPVGGCHAAGDDPAAAPDHGVLEIMTGAALPRGFDAVVRLEDVEVRRDARGAPLEVAFRAPVPPRKDVRPRGEDYREGDPVATAGTLLRPEHILAFAALGCVDVLVRRRPRVAVIATGKELLPADARELPPGGIRDCSTPYLSASASALGATVVARTSTGDDTAALRAEFLAAQSAGADLVLTTGAVSMGKYDFVPAVLEELGATVLFHKVAVRPGKPVLLAELPGGPVVLGLPGNPIASAVSFRFLAVPLLRAMHGLPPEVPIRASLRRDTRKPEGFRCFFRATLEVPSTGPVVEVLPVQASNILSSLVAADSWAVLPESGRVVSAGTEVEVVPLAGAM